MSAAGVPAPAGRSSDPAGGATTFSATSFVVCSPTGSVTVTVALAGPMTGEDVQRRGAGRGRPVGERPGVRELRGLPRVGVGARGGERRGLPGDGRGGRAGDGHLGRAALVLVRTEVDRAVHEPQPAAEVGADERLARRAEVHERRGVERAVVARGRVDEDGREVRDARAERDARVRWPVTAAVEDRAARGERRPLDRDLVVGERLQVRLGAQQGVRHAGDDRVGELDRVMVGLVGRPVPGGGRELARVLGADDRQALRVDRARTRDRSCRCRRPPGPGSRRPGAGSASRSASACRRTARRPRSPNPRSARGGRSPPSRALRPRRPSPRRSPGRAGRRP